MLNPDNALDHALQLAEFGTTVFPCLDNKAPACERGFLAATTDIKILKRLWNNSAVLVGVPTFFMGVLDIDPRHGGDKWLAANTHRLPRTRIHQTRSGGQHIFFNRHKGLRNSAGKIAPGVDVRAEGGYIIWWPAAGFPVLSDAPLADWPEWLLELAMPKPAEIKRADFTPHVTGSGYAHAALKDAVKKVATAPEGQRNDTLNRETWSLLRFVSNGNLCVQDIANTLAAAGLAAGLTRPEIMATLVSALRSRGIA